MLQSPISHGGQQAGKTNVSWFACMRKFTLQINFKKGIFLLSLQQSDVKPVYPTAVKVRVMSGDHVFLFFFTCNRGWVCGATVYGWFAFLSPSAWQVDEVVNKEFHPLISINQGQGQTSKVIYYWRQKVKREKEKVRKFESKQQWWIKGP